MSETLLHKYLDAKVKLNEAKTAIEIEFSKITGGRYEFTASEIGWHRITIYGVYPVCSMTESELGQVWGMGFYGLALEFADGGRDEYVAN